MDVKPKGLDEERLKPEQVRALERHAAALYPPPIRHSIIAFICLVIGIVGFVVGLLLFPGRAWGSLLANFMFWTGLCQAGIVVGAVFNVASAWWGRVIQRITAALVAFLPFSLIVLLILWFGRAHIFGWLGLPDRSPWLNIGPLFLRDALCIIITGAVSWYALYRALRVDMNAAIEEGDVRREGFAAFLTRNWKGVEQEEEIRRRTLRGLAPAIILLYVFGYTIVAIDMMMTLDPHFRSTMFPVIYYMGEFFAALCANAVLLSMWLRKPAVAEIVGPSDVMDLANLMWGFSIFWAYITFSQYIVIWYANFPDEAEWFSVRWRTWHYGPLAWTMLFCVFIIPFLTLFLRGLKRNPGRLPLVAAVGMLGVLLQMFLFIYPSIPNLGGQDFCLVEIAVSIGFMGAVALPYLWLMRRVPVFPVEDPLFVHALATRGVEV